MSKRIANRNTERRESVVADLLRAIDDIAPLTLAADWDNVGLLAGDESWPARRVLLAIDLTDAVASEALRKHCDAVVVYHPPIFKGIKSVSSRADGPTRHLATLLRSGVSTLATHTAMDAAIGGTNDVLLDPFDCVSRTPLEPVIGDSRSCKLVVFAPATEVDRLRAALSGAGAGVIGNYGECGFELRGRGSFRGNDAANPTIGQRGRLEFVDETRLEMVVAKSRLADVVRTLHATHTYEEPAYDIYPLTNVADRGQTGMGRVGVLRKPLRGAALVKRLATICDLRTATVVGDLARTFSSVTSAAGSFGVRAFRDVDSLVITGEFKHHDALDLLRRGVTAIAVGHYASERPALDRLCNRLRDILRHATFTIARNDADPFRPLRHS